MRRTIPLVVISLCITLLSCPAKAGLSFFGPATFEECRQKYSWETNKENSAKAAIAFACYAKFNTNPEYLSHLSSDQKGAFLDAASCLLKYRDDVYSPDSALKVATICANKYESRIFVQIVKGIVYPKNDRDFD